MANRVLADVHSLFRVGFWFKSRPRGISRGISHTKVDTIHTKVDMPLTQHPFNDGTGKCDVMKCPFATVDAVAYICGIDECTKKVHLECFHRLVLPQQGKDPLPPLPDECLACTKKHYYLVVKLAKPVKVYRWSNDAKPETPTVTGEWILVDWLTKDDNYVKYKGKDNGGHTKKHYCLIMASKCTQLTVCERTHDSVLTKVMAMEDQWRQTHDWVNNTGQGVLVDDGQEHFDKTVKSRCSFYYDLEPIMIDRAGTNPVVTSENLGDSDDDDEDEDDADVGSESSSIPKVITQSTTDKPASDRKMTVAEKKALDKKKRASYSGGSTVGSVSVIDVETKQMFANAKSSSADRIKQAADHHQDLVAHQREMKELEERKVVLQENAAKVVDWSQKTAETTYKYNLYLKYKSMSEDGWPDEMILDLMPELEAVIKAKSVVQTVDSPVKPPAKKKNKTTTTTTAPRSERDPRSLS